MAAISGGNESPHPATHDENFALVRSMAPGGGIQSMMAVHLVSIHNAIVKMSALLNSADGTRSDRLVDAISKLSRAYSAEVEALMRHQARAPKKASEFKVNVILARPDGVCKAEHCQWVPDAQKFTVVELDGTERVITA